jgi:hypothetical protein
MSAEDVPMETAVVFEVAASGVVGEDVDAHGDGDGGGGGGLHADPDCMFSGLLRCAFGCIRTARRVIVGSTTVHLEACDHATQGQLLEFVTQLWGPCDWVTVQDTATGKHLGANWPLPECVTVQRTVGRVQSKARTLLVLTAQTFQTGLKTHYISERATAHLVLHGQGFVTAADKARTRMFCYDTTRAIPPETDMFAYDRDQPFVWLVTADDAGVPSLVLVGVNVLGADDAAIATRDGVMPLRADLVSMAQVAIDRSRSAPRMKDIAIAKVLYAGREVEGTRLDDACVEELKDCMARGVFPRLRHTLQVFLK